MSLNESSESIQDPILEKDSEGYQAPPRPGNARKAILFGILAVAIAALAFQTYQQQVLVADAAPLAEMAIEEFTEPGLEVVSHLTVTRDLLFFGTPHAKVEVFVRPSGTTDSNAIRGIEYYYVLDDDKWLFQDSGSCTSEECTLRGNKAFNQQ